jgi:hypothetical protein
MRATMIAAAAAALIGWTGAANAQPTGRAVMAPNITTRPGTVTPPAVGAEAPMPDVSMAPEAMPEVSADAPAMPPVSAEAPPAAATEPVAPPSPDMTTCEPAADGSGCASPGPDATTPAPPQ